MNINILWQCDHLVISFYKILLIILSKSQLKTKKKDIDFFFLTSYFFWCKSISLNNNLIFYVFLYVIFAEWTLGTIIQYVDTVFPPQYAMGHNCPSAFWVQLQYCDI